MKEQLKFTWTPTATAGVTKREISITTPDGVVTQEVPLVDAMFTYLADFNSALIVRTRVFRGDESVESQELAVVVPAGPLLPDTGLAVEDLGPVEG